MDASEIEALHRGLIKKGFHVGDAQLHECAAPVCKLRAVRVYQLTGGKPGGRDIELCHACGHARSWSRRGLSESRDEDLPFDLRTYLGLSRT